MAQETVVQVPLEVQSTNGSENGSGGAAKAVNFFSLKPQLLVQAPKAAEAVSFYKSAFAAEEVNRDIHPKRKADQDLPLIRSAELKIGSSLFIVSDHTADISSIGSGCTLCLETNDVEAAVAKAVKAGGTVLDGGEVAEGDTACCGARVAQVKDPYGYVWSICSGNKVAADVEA